MKIHKQMEEQMEFNIEFWFRISMMVKVLLVIGGIGSLMLDHDRELREEARRKR